MHSVLVKFTRYGLLCYEARLYIGTKVYKSFSCLSEGSARSWLAKQGVSFEKQPTFALGIRSNH